MTLKQTGGDLAFESDGHVVLTGPIATNITLSDGTVVDCRAAVVEVPSPEHAAELAHLIGLHYEENGHPSHSADEPFLHYCSPAICGEHARDVTEQPIQTERAQAQALAVEDPTHRAEVARLLGFDAEDPGLQMALASATAENAALNGLDGTGSTNVIPDVSLHTASPGTTGANENANTGSYARQACSWNAASGGSKTNSTALTFSTAGSVAVTHFGTWSSATYGAGNYAIGGALTASVTAASITVAAGAITLSAS